VLFLLHGRGGARRDWVQHGRIDQQLDAALGRETAGRVLVVLPEGHLNEAEREKKQFPDSRAFMERLQEVVDNVNTTILPDPAAFWAIAGVSMGAQQALNYVQEQPGRFGAVGCFSPALSDEWMKGDAAKRIAAAGKRPEFYIVWGTGDDAEIKMNGGLFAKRLQEAGVVVRPASDKQEREGAHNWSPSHNLWQNCLRDFLSEMISPRLRGSG
jgi:enterochelin esterase-like enzyme